MAVVDAVCQGSSSSMKTQVATKCITADTPFLAWCHFCRRWAICCFFWVAPKTFHWVPPIFGCLSPDSYSTAQVFNMFPLHKESTLKCTPKLSITQKMLVRSVNAWSLTPICQSLIPISNKRWLCKALCYTSMCAWILMRCTLKSGWPCTYTDLHFHLSNIKGLILCLPLLCFLRNFATKSHFMVHIIQ